jgi:hypothetical protein
VWLWQHDCAADDCGSVTGSSIRTTAEARAMVLAAALKKDSRLVPHGALQPRTSSSEKNLHHGSRQQLLAALNHPQSALTIIHRWLAGRLHHDLAE